MIGAMKKWGRRVLIGLLIVLALVGLGWLFADQLMPRASGEPSHTLPVAADATELDRAIAPLLAEHPGQTGAVMVNDGLDAFAVRAATARAAGRSLDLMYYLWHDDITGRLLGRELWMAANRDVRVRLLLDDMTATGKDRQLLALDSHPNIEIRIYNPARNRAGIDRVFEMLVRALRHNHRMHNKAWIADNRVAVVGGRNIGVEYFDASNDANFHDLDVALVGPAVAQSSAIFDEFWNSEAAIPISALSSKPKEDLETFLAGVDLESEQQAARGYLERIARHADTQSYFDRAAAVFWGEDMHVASDPPIKWNQDRREDWLVNRLERHIGQTRQQALLISPYFVPGEDFTQQLTGLARSGREIAIVTNSLAANDVLAVHSGYMRYRQPLLEAGIQLNELRTQPEQDSDYSAFGSSGASLHTKAFVIDDERGFIGSFNLDPRSAYLNTEMGLMFAHPGLAAALKKEFAHLQTAKMSYQVELDANGQLQWVDASHTPPRTLDTEPDTTRWQRLVVRVLGWLPIESQL